MIARQDPLLRTRFVLDFRFVEALVEEEKPQAVLSDRGLLIAHKRDVEQRELWWDVSDSWFDPYARARLKTHKDFAPVRSWLKTTQSKVVYQPAFDRTVDADFGQALAANLFAIAMVFLDDKKAALFKLTFC
jgi:hypothetical protein